MNFIYAFNKATKKFTDYFNYIEKELDKPPKEIEENLILVNSQIMLWIKDDYYEEDDYHKLLNQKFQNKFKILNCTKNKINFKGEQDKIFDCPPPDYPSYSLDFLINTSVIAKKVLLQQPDNTLIIYDDNQMGKIFSLLSCLISYNTSKDNIPLPPLDVYSNLITLNKTMDELFKKSEVKNQMRYINYFSSMQNNPIISLKKNYLKCIIISGAPAIENTENSKSSPYITINNKSFYAPVIRIITNGKIIYCSYQKNIPVDKIFYSIDSPAKFVIDKLLFGDTCIEMLHKTEGKFKLLFTIQFNTFFISNNSIRFSRDQIDSVYRDIRYPNEFFIELIFDQEKDVELSSYDEESIKWKSILSEFILNGYQAKKETKEERSKEEQKKEHLKENTKKTEEMQVVSLKESEKDEEVGTSSSTVNKVEDLLGKIGIDEKEGAENEDDDEDEDVEKYLKNLENKKG